MLIVVSVFNGMTMNKKRRLDHELLSSPETCILIGYGYKSPLSILIAICIDKGKITFGE